MQHNTYYFLFNHYKIKIFGVAFIVVFFALIFSAFTEKKTPLEQTRQYCLENIKKFQAQLDTLQQLGEQKVAKDILLQRFINARVAFKRFEFIAELVDNGRYPFFNGANALETDEGMIMPDTKPEGLQIIESELQNDSLNYNNIVYLTKKLKYRTLSFYLILKDAPIVDSYIFEAIRFHLIRIEALSLVSFDSPNIRNNTNEINAALQTFTTILSFYANDKTEIEIRNLNNEIHNAIKYLSAKNFSNLDRLFFIKKYLQPITGFLSNVQHLLAIPYLDDNGKVFRAVNLNAHTIYDSNFLNPAFYAQDKFHKTNALYIALGKKLFFDKQLSADRSMSCATCHQPAKFFTDGLPTAITNKTGIFQARNTPTILNAALQSAYFYDLSATSLETQVDHVVVNPQEYNHNYDSIINRLKKDSVYLKLFSEAFPQYKNDAISISGINTCIADFERQFIRLDSPFDKYMRGQTTTIPVAVKRGFNLFMGKAQCGSCHFPPTFFGTAPPFYGTTEAEVLGVTQTFDTIHPVLDEDIGQFKNFQLDQFKHSIKTSTVRNASVTAPYMHNGGFKTLEEVIEFYNQGGGAGLGLDIPNQTLPSKKLNLSSKDKNDIVLFIKYLTDTTAISNLK